MSDAATLMDDIYRYQRHIYDLTRKFYLLGRDRLIADLNPPPSGRVLEIGCGTARNLIRVARLYPNAICYGVDVSDAMLVTARRSIEKAGLSHRIFVAQADATCFDTEQVFGVRGFDRVMISYALSMIPPWQAVLRRASQMVAPGGALLIVDFGDQAGLPRAFKRLLYAWLARFHVEPRRELAQEVRRLAEEQGWRAETRARYRGYAICAAVARA